MIFIFTTRFAHLHERSQLFCFAFFKSAVVAMEFTPHHPQHRTTPHHIIPSTERPHAMIWSLVGRVETLDPTSTPPLCRTRRKRNERDECEKNVSIAMTVALGCIHPARQDVKCWKREHALIIVRVPMSSAEHSPAAGQALECCHVQQSSCRICCWENMQRNAPTIVSQVTWWVQATKARAGKSPSEHSCIAPHED
jgi:hypothetical protein